MMFGNGDVDGCSDFGSYHSTFQIDQMPINYGVMPDCGFNLGQHFVLSSHELVGAITNPSVGLIDEEGVNYAAAWYSMKKGEVRLKLNGR